MTSTSKLQATIARVAIAFQQPAYRWLWLTAIFGAMSHAANGLAMGWLVLETTDSAFWVGAVGGMMGVGEVAFGVFGGVLLDRYDKRRVLLISQSIGAFLPLIVGTLVLTDQIALWHLFAVNLAAGIISTVRAPAFQTITFHLVGPKRILNATATMSLGFNLAMILAPFITGIAIDRWDESIGFFLATLFGLCGVLTLFFVAGEFRTESNSEPLLQSAIAGLKYVWNNVQLRKLLSLSLIGETFGFSFLVMLPVVARDVLGLGATGLGVLSTARAIGAGVATVGVASLGDYDRKGQLLVRSVTGAGISMVLFGLSPWYAVSLVLVAILGGMMNIYDITMKSLILMLTGDAWRGRVQSIYTLTYGFVSLGGFLAGSIASLIGVSYTLAINGSILATSINTFARHFRTLSGTNE